MNAVSFHRARNPQAKLRRANEILEAARVLGSERGIGNVSLTDIAEAIGMHKSALLRYFETREQIFLILAASAWLEWADDVKECLRQTHPCAPASIAAALAKSLGTRAFFCDIVAHTSLSLERRVSMGALKEFKAAALDATYMIAEELQKLCSLTERQAIDTIATATTMAGALWQTATPSPEVLALYRDDPRLNHVIGDIAPRLSHILESLLIGFCAKNDGVA